MSPYTGHSYTQAISANACPMSMRRIVGMNDMKEIYKLFCNLGWHNWYEHRGRPTYYERKCRHCSKQETVNFIYPI